MQHSLSKERYRPVNRATYNALAAEYNVRWRKYASNQKTVLHTFQKVLRARFKNPITILDVGCGVGLDAYILSEAGFRVTGIDIAEKMVDFARANAPKTNFRVGNFLSAKFPKRFQGILMNGFIHLFPKRDVPDVLKKLKKALGERGIALISTNDCSVSKEGYAIKRDYKIARKRYRKYWTLKELRSVLEREGFRILHVGRNYNQSTHKHWINLIVSKRLKRARLTT